MRIYRILEVLASVRRGPQKKVFEVYRGEECIAVSLPSRERAEEIVAFDREQDYGGSN